MKCTLVDVFAERKLAGNGLTIFSEFDELSDQRMLELTREMRQFESIFVSPGKEDGQFRARIFTVEEELDFAGHPIIGLGAYLSDSYGGDRWQVELNQQTVEVHTEAHDEYFRATMDQGQPEFLKTLAASEAVEFATAFDLTVDDLAELPMEVVTTGLSYLIIPIRAGIDRARITVPDLEARLEKHGAKFAYLLDVDTLEGRTWDNAGAVEDIATGSAAGPSAAYLYKHGRIAGNTDFEIAQGRFTGRPSQIAVKVESSDAGIERILVSGSVVKVANIDFL